MHKNDERNSRIDLNVAGDEVYMGDFDPEFEAASETDLTPSEKAKALAYEQQMKALWLDQV